MFFDDAAAGAERKSGRLVVALGVERRQAREGQGRRAVRRRVARGKINQDEVAARVGANPECGVCVVLEMDGDLGGQVHADAENLV